MSLVERSPQEENISENTLENQTPKTSFFGKIKFFFFGFIILSVIIIIGTSLYASSHSLTIDNPTDEIIVVQIDGGESISIPAQSSVVSKIKKGTHTVVVDGKEVGTFEKASFDMNPLLNPTLDEYVIEHIFYGEEPYYDANMPTFSGTFLGGSLQGPFEVKTGLYITNSWDYNLDEISPDEITLDQKENFSIKTKIYRPKDFAIMYMTYYASEEELSGEVVEEETSSQ